MRAWLAHAAWYCLIRSATSSLQGLYATLPATGQLLLLDWGTGNASAVGASLSAQGWRVPECTPSAIDPTNKWYYTLARNASAPSGSPWSLVTASLADGSVVASAPLPPCYPPELAACDHALCAGGALEVFVSVETPHARVVAGCLSPGPPSSFELLVNASVGELGVGPLVSPPSLAVTSSALWLPGQHGVAGVPLSRSSPDRQLLLSTNETLRGLHAGAGDVVFGYIQDRSTGEAFVASFIDTGAGSPVLVCAPLPLPPLFASNVTILTALVSDRGSFALLGDGYLITANVTSGALESSVRLQCSHAISASQLYDRGCATGCPLDTLKAQPCPSSMAYEPFVF